jgi:hypothetical protein
VNSAEHSVGKCVRFLFSGLRIILLSITCREIRKEAQDNKVTDFFGCIILVVFPAEEVENTWHFWIDCQFSYSEQYCTILSLQNPKD